MKYKFIKPHWCAEGYSNNWRKAHHYPMRRKYKKYHHKISNYKTGKRTEIMIAENMKSRYGDKNKQIICDHRGDNHE